MPPCSQARARRLPPAAGFGSFGLTVVRALGLDNTVARLAQLVDISHTLDLGKNFARLFDQPPALSNEVLGILDLSHGAPLFLAEILDQPLGVLNMYHPMMVPDISSWRTDEC